MKTSDRSLKERRKFQVVRHTTKYSLPCTQYNQNVKDAMGIQHKDGTVLVLINRTCKEDNP